MGAGTVAATSAAVVVAAVMAAGLSTIAPATARIELVDNTIALEPGDGSLTDDQTLTPFDVQNPAIGRLDPRLLTAIQNAARAAAVDGVTMTVTSGWRSPEFQQRLLNEAVQTYGSLAAARQYVQTPAASRHVTGEAVDIGGTGADQWLIANGSWFGLCQIYANELWHFELVADPAGNCPALLPDAAE
jgi:hypothetical protein